MVEMFFSPHGYLYQNGLKDIRRAYDETMGAMDALRGKAEQRKERVIAKIASGEMKEYEFEYDESKIDVCDFLIEETEDAANISRSAFVVILYHYWEKSTSRWIKRARKEPPEDVYEKLEAVNVPLDRIGLERLRKLTNYIKHESRLCRSDHPELFDRRESMFPGVRINHEDDLWIKPEHMDEFFETMRKSGYEDMPPSKFF